MSLIWSLWHNVHMQRNMLNSGDIWTIMYEYVHLHFFKYYYGDIMLFKKKWCIYFCAYVLFTILSEISHVKRVKLPGSKYTV